MKYCEVGRCNRPGEGHHITPRSLGGCDCKENKITMCRLHHSLLHSIGKWIFAKRFNLVEKFREAEAHYKECAKKLFQ